MPEEVLAFGWYEAVQELADFFITEPHAQQKSRDRALAGFDAARQKLDAKLMQR
jgi:hypothetical protein